MPPALAASAAKALDILHREPERVARLQHNAALFARLAKERGLDLGTGAGTAIAPIIIGDSLPTVMLSEALLERGINVMPVLHPAVPAKQARLRFFLSAAHSEADIARALDETVSCLGDVRKRMTEIDIRG
jgi:7-keto-8-aminopelargonate synthetase-like enzyme